MGRAQSGGDGRLDVLLGDAHRFLSSSPVRFRWCDGLARRRPRLEPPYLLLFGFWKIFFRSTAAIFIFSCSSQSPSGLGIEYLADLYS
jgi:hypothetical protein